MINRLTLIAVLLIVFIGTANATTVHIYSPNAVALNHKFTFSVVVDNMDVKANYTLKVSIVKQGGGSIWSDVEMFHGQIDNLKFDYNLAITLDGDYTIFAKLQSDAGEFVSVSKDLSVVDINEIESSIENVESKIDAINDSIDQINSKLAYLVERVNENTISLSELESDINSINETLASLTDEINDLKSEIDSIKSSLNDLGDQFADLMNRVNTDELMINNLAEHLENISSVVTDLVLEVSEIKQSVDELSSNVENLNVVIEDIKGDISSLQVNDTTIFSTIDAIEQSLDDLKNLHEKDMSRVWDEISTLSYELMLLQVQLSSLRNYVNESDQRLIDYMIDNVTALKNVIDSKCNELKLSISDLSSEVAKLSNDLKSTKNELANVKNKVSSVESKFESVEDYMTYKLGGDDIYDAIDEIKDRFDKIEYLIKQLQYNDTALYGNISRIMNETNSLSERIDQVKKELEAYMNRTNKTLNNITATLNNITAEIDNIKAELSKLESKLHHINDVIKELLKPQKIEVSMIDEHNVTIKVTTYDDMPVPHATIVVVTNNTTLNLHTDENGTCVLNISKYNIHEGELMKIYSYKLGYVNASYEYTVPVVNRTPGFEAFIGVVAVLIILAVRKTI